MKAHTKMSSARETLAHRLSYKKGSMELVVCGGKRTACVQELVDKLHRLILLVVDLRGDIAMSSTIGAEEKNEIVQQIDYDCRMIELYLREVKSGINRLPDMECHLTNIKESFASTEIRESEP
jgi:hypothetical protein